MACPISTLACLVNVAFQVYNQAEVASQNNKECISLSKNLEKLCSILKYIQEDVSKDNKIDILSDSIMVTTKYCIAVFHAQIDAACVWLCRVCRIQSWRPQN
jgi:hypothetical protein